MRGQQSSMNFFYNYTLELNLDQRSVLETCTGMLRDCDDERERAVESLKICEDVGESTSTLSAPSAVKEDDREATRTSGGMIKYGQLRKLADEDVFAETAAEICLPTYYVAAYSVFAFITHVTCFLLGGCVRKFC